MASICEYYGLTKVSAHPLPVKLAKDAELRLFPLKSEQIIGIEVEVENNRTTNTQLSNCWNITEDGSLRNGGVEYVSRPMKACDAVYAIAHLFQKVLMADCCYSPRTSVHIHLNVQDMQIQQLRCFMGLYTIFERGFYKFVGRNRRNNIYCVPLAECRLLPNVGNENPIRNWFKYTGLNLIPVGTQGTVEFRHMHGTPDVDKLSRWIGIITRLKDYVMMTNVKELEQILLSLNTKADLLELARVVFGEFADYLPINPEVNDIIASKQVFMDGTTAATIISSRSAKSPFLSFVSK